MLKRIASLISDWPIWARHDARYRRLDILDRFIEGRFYDHLLYCFTEDKDRTNNYIPMLDRRPSVQFNLPRQVAKRTARKLFAGRQRPRLVHKDDAIVRSADAIAKEGFLNQRIMLAAVWGSVGSVAVTFKILPDPRGTPRIVYDVWRAKHCRPAFDPLGELKRLRVNFVTSGAELLCSDIRTDYEGEPIDGRKSYWFLRDYTTEAEITYKPVLEADYDPIDPECTELEVPDIELRHDLGFVPGHWFVNLSGGAPPDGDCTWLPAVNTSIVIDYTLSQLGFGLWYNASPQVVMKGELKNQTFGGDGGIVIRGPTHVLQFEADIKGVDGSQVSGGDAKLLEMNGNAIREGIPYVEALRNYALEQIQASRKDPQKLSGQALSGKAMEVLEEDFLDLTQEQRTAYGEHGFLPLLRKSLWAAAKASHPALAGVSVDDADGLELQWPKAFTPTADEFEKLSTSLLKLMAPQVVELGKPGRGQDGAAIAAPEPIVLPPLLSEAEGRAILEAWIDIPRLETTTVPAQQEPLLEERPDPGYAQTELEIEA